MDIPADDDGFVAAWQQEDFRKEVRACDKLTFDKCLRRYQTIMGKISPDERPQAKPESKTYQFRTHSEMFEERQPAEWLIKNVLPRYGVTLMFGADGTGKSFLAVDMALSIVTGKRWFGYRTRPYGDVLYVVAEGRIEDRVEAWLATHGKTREEVDAFKYVNGCPDLSDEAGRAKLASAVHACKPCLVIVDTLASASPSGSENEKQAVAPVLELFRDIARMHNCCVIFISHRGKDITRGVRGWSGQRANSDCVIEINRNEDLHEWVVTKQREGADGEHAQFMLGFVKISVDECGDECHTRIVNPLEV